MDLYNYINYRSFLKDAYFHRKSRDKSFTHAWISKQAGLKSTGFFSWVLNGKRNITPALAQKFAGLFDLNKTETEFFLLLVQYDQAKTSDVKNELFLKIVKHKKSKISLAGLDQHAYFKNWYHAAIREVIAIRPFHGNYKQLAKSLIPRITPAEARGSVQLLSRLGLVSKTKSGAYQFNENTITTGDDWRSMAIQNFQHAMGQLGAEAVRRIQKKERDISTLTLSGSDELFQAYKEKLKDLRREFLQMAKRDNHPEKVFQINLQLFPLTENLKMDDGDKS